MERFKFRTFPLMKCGADPVTAGIIGGAAVSGGAGILGNIIGTASANNMQSENIQLQREENQKNRDFQAEQAELARSFTTDERIAQQLYQSQQWQHQFDEETRVQSPAYQASQLHRAGINPAVYFSRSAAFQGGQSPSVSAPSGATSPLPQGSSGLSGIAPIVPQFPQLLSSAADLVSSLSQAKKVGAEIPNIEAGTNLIYEQILGEKLINEAKDFQNFLRVQKAPLELQKLANEVMSEYALSALRTVQGEEVKESTKLKIAEQKLTKALEDMNIANKDYIIEQYTQLKNSYNARMANLRSSTYKNNQEGNLAKESAEEKAFWNEFNSTNVDTLRDRLEMEVYNSTLSAEEKELFNQQLGFEVDKQELKFWHDLIVSDLNMVIDGVLDYTKLGSFKNLTDAQKQRVNNRIDELKLQREKFDYEKGTYEHSESYMNSRGHKVTKTGRVPKPRR